MSVGDVYSEVVKYAIRTFENYARKHGYDLFVKKEINNIRPSGTLSRRDIPWYKIKVISEALPFYDYVMWLDADGHILNPNVSVEEMIKETSLSEGLSDIICVNDWNSPINTGFMILKNTPFVTNLLEKIWDNKNDFDPAFHEQASFSQLYVTDEKIRDKVNVLPYDKNNIVCYWSSYLPNKYFYFHAARCKECNGLKSLVRALDMFCPIKIDDEPGIIYRQRMKWLKNIEECRRDIDRMIKGEEIYIPTRATMWKI